MKRILTTLCIATCAVAMQAASLLVVNLKSGAKVTFALEATPVVTFADSQLTITAEGTEAATYELSDVRTFTFEDENSGVGLPQAASGLLLQGHLLTLPAGASQVEVVAADGKATGLRPQGPTLNLGSLRPGIYIVRIDQLSFKFVKK